jgi:predicted dehydrogenase
LLTLLTTIPASRCVATCDIYPVNLKRGVEATGSHPATFTDYRRLLQRTDIDAVFIATPLYLHAPMLIDSLQAGKHVYVEKSMFFKEEELKPILQAASARPKQVIQVGLQCRSNGMYKTAMEMIRKGALGKLTFARAQWHRYNSWRRPVVDPELERLINWRMYREYSGGLMAEWGSHQVDVVNWAFDSRPDSVVGTAGIDYWKDCRETYDNVEAIFQYPRGETLVFSAILSSSHGYEYEEISGDQGTFVISLESKGLYLREPAAKVSTAKVKEDWWAGATVTRLATEKGVQIYPEDEANSQDPSKRHIEDFFAGIRHGKPVAAPLGVGVTDALTVIYANRAIDSGQRVHWPKKEA